MPIQATDHGTYDEIAAAQKKKQIFLLFSTRSTKFLVAPQPDDCELRVRPAHQIVLPVNDPGDVAKNTKDEVTSTLGA